MVELDLLMIEPSSQVKIGVQCKQRQGRSVGAPELRKFKQQMECMQVDHGWMVCVGSFVARSEARIRGNQDALESDRLG